VNRYKVVRVEDVVLDQLRQIAGRNHRSMAQQIAWFVDQYNQTNTPLPNSAAAVETDSSEGDEEEAG